MLTLVLAVMLKTRLESLPLTLRLPAASPSIVSALSIISCPLLNMIVPLVENLIRSPSVAIASASRNEPAPASAREVTLMGKDNLAGSLVAEPAVLETLTR